MPSRPRQQCSRSDPAPPRAARGLRGLRKVRRPDRAVAPSPCAFHLRALLGSDVRPFRASWARHLRVFSGKVFSLSLTF